MIVNEPSAIAKITNAPRMNGTLLNASMHPGYHVQHRFAMVAGRNS